MLNLASVGCVATTCVATLGVGFLTSCRMATRGTPMLNIASFGDVVTEGVASTSKATLGFGIPCVRWHPVHLCQICHLVLASVFQRRVH
jgi:hypothetical protein